MAWSALELQRGPEEGDQPDTAPPHGVRHVQAAAHHGQRGVVRQVPRSQAVRHSRPPLAPGRAAAPFRFGDEGLGISV